MSQKKGVSQVFFNCFMEPLLSFSYGESVTYMDDKANLEEASKEVLIKTFI